MSRTGRGKSIARLIMKEFFPTIGYNETEVERILLKARESGIIHEFDSGRGEFFWLVGWPGKSLRRLVKQLHRVMTKQFGVHRG